MLKKGMFVRAAVKAAKVQKAAVKSIKAVGSTAKEAVKAYREEVKKN